MTALLEQAFTRAAAMPEALQDELAAELIDELEGEKRWDATFAATQPALDALAAEALRQYRSGKTVEGGFDTL